VTSAAGADAVAKGWATVAGNRIRPLPRTSLYRGCSDSPRTHHRACQNNHQAGVGTMGTHAVGRRGDSRRCIACPRRRKPVESKILAANGKQREG